MLREALIIKGLLIFLLIADVIVLLCQFATTSYDVTSVTPLFFLRFANYMFPLSIFLATLSILASFVMRDRVLLTFSSLVLYFAIFLAPYNIFRFPIYNDQLGFAFETLYGMREGVVVPYQGEYSTLGHAFFTSITGNILGLNLFQATRFAEVVFVVACFVVYLSLTISVLKEQGSTSLFVPTLILILPAFALEPLVYSRGYFGFVVSTILFCCMFKFMKEGSVRSSVLANLTFAASSISYPLPPLIVVIALALFVLFYRLIPPLGKREHERESRRAMLKAVVFFVIWSAIQVYIGYASWKILHEIIWKTLAQEFFTGLEQPALRYVGEAAVYTNLRMLMVASGWLIAAFIALAFILSFLRNRNFSGVELYAFSLISSFCFLGAFYGVAYHEPALRFYRNLIAALPFSLTYVRGKIAVRGLPRKMIVAFLLAITTAFLILSPVTKWGWTFVGYPTEHDVAQCNYIISYYGSSSRSVLYAPGSHALFLFFTELTSVQTDRSLRVYAPGDVEFNIDESMRADYTATFYRMYIYPRWLGKDVNITMNEVMTLTLQNNVLYSNGDLWVTFGKML